MYHPKPPEMMKWRQTQEGPERLLLVGENERQESTRAKVFGEEGDYDFKIRFIKTVKCQLKHSQGTQE